MGLSSLRLNEIDPFYLDRAQGIAPYGDVDEYVQKHIISDSKKGIDRDFWVKFDPELVKNTLGRLPNIPKPKRKVSTGRPYTGIGSDAWKAAHPEIIKHGANTFELIPGVTILNKLEPATP
jgi:hypothetical protein